MLSVLLAAGLLSGPAASAQITIEKPDMERGTTVADRILAIEDSAMEEWRKGNPMRWAEISAEDVTYLDPGLAAPVVGRKAYVEYLTPLKGKIFYDASEYVDPRVAIHGDVAVLTYNYHSLRKDASGALKRTSFWNTTEIYRLVAGDWKIVHTHWSYIRHSLPESLELTLPVLTKDVSPLQGDVALILGREVGALERYRKGDPTGYLDIYVPEVTYFDSGTPDRVNGLEAVKKELVPRAGKVHYDVSDFVQTRFQIYGDTAVFFFRYLATSVNPNGTIQKRVPWNCTEVYAKVAGEWKIIHSHWSLIKGERKGGGV
jgi:ketosteroid isomerase-like protein